MQRRSYKNRIMAKPVRSQTTQGTHPGISYLAY